MAKKNYLKKMYYAVLSYFVFSCRKIWYRIGGHFETGYTSSKLYNSLRYNAGFFATISDIFCFIGVLHRCLWQVLGESVRTEKRNLFI